MRFRSCMVSILFFFLSAAGRATSNGDLSLTTATVEEFSQKPAGLGPYLRIELRYAGVYRINGKELSDAGLDLTALDPQKLSLWNEGHLLPMRVRTKDSRAFRPDDFIEFVGEPPRGTFSYYKPDNLYNVYYLSWLSGAGLHYEEANLSPSDGPVLAKTSFIDVQHRERDTEFRYSMLEPGITDNFFWLNMQAGNSGHVPLFVSFPGFDASPNKPVKLKFKLFGYTNVAGLKPGHKFSAWYGDYELGTFSFDGVKYYDFETSIPASRVRERMGIRFEAPADRANVVDQVFLDNIEVTYPRHLDSEGREYFVFSNQLLDEQLPKPRVLVRGLAPGSVVFSPAEQRIYSGDPESTGILVSMLDYPTTFVAVSPLGRLRPDSITLRDLKRELDVIDPGIEALVIYHPDVAKAAAMYVHYRQQNGERIKSISAPDIYDALNNGFVSDKAIKRYIRYVVGKAKNLKFIVLFGDSTFDYREARTFDDEIQPRILIPIHWVVNPSTTWTGGYQDDNWYGAIADQYRPDLAVGRIPARNDSEGIEYVRKLIEYETEGLTRNSKGLLITSVEKSFQELVREIATKYADRLSTFTLLYPESAEATREVKRLKDEINSGTQVIYYVGHGGSMVWRVGPADFSQQKDLFTPADVRTLTNAGMYPVIACSSCYTTSFDQVNCLGEALLMQPEAGAIAVLGSPWKATVYEGHAFNSAFFKYYFDPGKERVGDALRLALRDTIPANSTSPRYESFTLLGDPCLKILRR